MVMQKQGKRIVINEALRAYFESKGYTEVVVQKPKTAKKAKAEANVSGD